MKQDHGGRCIQTVRQHALMKFFVLESLTDARQMEEVLSGESVGVRENMSGFKPYKGLVEKGVFSYVNTVYIWIVLINKL